MLQIQTPQPVAGNVLTLPTLVQDRPAPAAAPPVVSVSFANPSSDEDVSAVHMLSHDSSPSPQRVRFIDSTGFNPLLGHMLLVAHHQRALAAAGLRIA